MPRAVGLLPVPLLALLGLALLLPLPGAAGEGETVALVAYPWTIAGDEGTIVPLQVRFQGEPQNDYEISAWLYGSSQWPSEVWTGSEFKRTTYQPIDLNASGGWEGWLHLRLKFQPPEGSYLKVRVRNASDADDRVDVQTYDFALPAEWGWVAGFAGNGTAPTAGAFIELRNATGLVAANVTGPVPWAPVPAGWFRLAAPPGNYTLRFADGSNATAVVIAANATTAVAFGYPLPAPGESRVLIEWLYYDPWLSGEADEAVALYNPGAPAELGGWSVGDATARAYFPAATRLDTGARLVVANNATAFVASHGYRPDFVLEPGEGVVVLAGDSAPRWANAGDVAIVRDWRGRTVDCVSYGDTTVPACWSGVPASRVPEGVYLHRDNDAGEGYRDTDSAADWTPYRVHRPGQTVFAPTSHTANALVAFASPDASYGVLVATLRNATRSIALSLYYLNHSALVDELVAAAGRGVAVEVLLEGAPVAGFGDAYAYHATRLVAAGAEVRLMRRGDAPTRYPYLHAKYALIDDRYAVVMSENWGHTGVPASGQGNRGWGVVLDAPSLVAALRSVFEVDFNTSFGDVVAATGLALPTGDPAAAGDYQGGYADPLAPLRIEGPVGVQLVIGPDTTLRNDTLLALLARANETIVVEQMQFTTRWGDRESPYLAALLAAARRGVAVRVLLDGIDQYIAEANQHAYQALREAAAEGLPVEVRLYRDGNFTRLHNKGVIVDERWTLVSSINWGVGGGALNREMGVIIDSPAVAAYYAELFERDWAVKTGAPPVPAPSPPPEDSPAPGAVVLAAAAAVAARARRAATTESPPRGGARKRRRER